MKKFRKKGEPKQEAKLYKTFSFRVKDKTSGKKLNASGEKVNFIWNYCKGVSRHGPQRKKWVTQGELLGLTKGSSKLIGLPAQIVQNVVFEFIKCRTAARRPKLRWRVSRGKRRSLGWIPFTNQDIEVQGGLVLLRSEKFHIWNHRDLSGPIKSGSFSQDARGRWYCNLVCEVEKPAATNRSKDVGIDLGFKTVAAASDGFDLDDGNFYRDLEVRLGDAQRRGDKRAVKTIHARIKNRRKDSLHKYSRAVVDGAGGVFVGNISANWQISSGKGKSVNDMGWSKLRNILKYKCDHAGVAYAEVFEAYTTQDCSCCLARTGPKGVEELNTRRWTCSECGAEHLRDRNAAINIARLGRQTLAAKADGSPVL